jgi:hypothetical protein
MTDPVNTDQAATLDLDLLVENIEGRVVLKHPLSGGPTAAVVTIAGPEHPARKGKLFALKRARRAALMASGGQLTIPDPTDDEADELDLLVVCTLGWSGINVKGAALVYTAAAARELYADPRRRWVREQVLAALDKRDLFISSSVPA